MDFMYFYVNHFVDRDMFMRFRGGGVGHKMTRDLDELLRSDGASVDDGDVEDFVVTEPTDDGDIDGEVDEGEDEDEDSDQDSDEDSEGENDGEEEDKVRADEGEELDDDVLAQEGYGAL
ncbi:hypothetical protein DFH29DRAFT_879939 [Suillus ampliporus]|nr:hypothetical protein DFH29DRAFT_879939 [Suillus ampliporus]